MNKSPLSGRHVLVVEDEMMIAMLIEDILTEHGCVVIGPATSVSQALQLIAEERIEVALLDVNLSGEESYPIAEELQRRKVPFLFATGYGSAGVREGYGQIATIQKPFDTNELARVVAMALAP